MSIQFKRRLAATALSVVALSIGWLGLSGLPLLFALVPLLWISGGVDDSREGWWSVFCWAVATFVLWNFATVWWIGFATLVGPFAATFASASYSVAAFMLFHTASKKVGKALGYVLLVSLWIAFEYNYTVSEFSWPWLLLGNGFSADIWAIQWYEYTGMFGGSLWVLLSNIFIYEAVVACGYERRVKSLFAAVVVVVPMVVSGYIFVNYGGGDSGRELRLAVVQPNVDCYEKFSGTNSWQEQNLLDLIDDVAAVSEANDGVAPAAIVMPETAIPSYYSEPSFDGSLIARRIKGALLRNDMDSTTVISGANTILYYDESERTNTSRKDRYSDRYYDIFNSAVAIVADGATQIRHKARLVIGVENTPTWVFDLFSFFVIDLGGVIGQIGVGDGGEVFDVNGVKVGAAVCYEGLYGDFYGDFVRNGAEVMTIISNDGWWEDTPGHRLLYSLSSLRAIEHRRAIARSANTGVSGFIDERGVSLSTMGWEERGVLVCDLPLNSELTFYTEQGDYVARVAVLLAILSLLYMVVFLVKRKQYLV